MEKIVYVGLDVHADTIAVAIADDGRNREIRFHGVIENTADSVLGLTKRLVAANTQPIFCYEAGHADTVCIACSRSLDLIVLSSLRP